MAIINNHWYNLNEQRSYPLDDTASARSNADLQLPSDIISDLVIRWPATYGAYCFLSSISVTEYVVTFLLEVSATLDASSGSTLIAGISVPKSELESGRTYPLESFEKGVGGFAAFGSGASLGPNYKGLFSSPEQGLITARAARATRTPPVTSLSVENVQAKVTGLVDFTAIEPLSITKETRIIEGVEYENVLVFRLVQNDGNTANNVFEEYAGPCGRRVGSKNCLDPQPIQTINGVTADCDGVITLDFQGEVLVGRNLTDCGVIVDSGLGLSDSCDPPYLPDLTTGKLPSELAPQLIPPPIPPEPPFVPDVSISETVVTVLTLPYCDTFDDGVAYGFNEVGNSVFIFTADDSPAEEDCCTDAAGGVGCDRSESTSDSGWVPVGPIVDSSYGTNEYAAQGVVDSETSIRPDSTSLWQSDVQSLYRKYITDVKIKPPTIGGGLRNAGIIINRFTVPSTGVLRYWVAYLNIEDSTFGIYYFNGAGLVPLVSTEVTDVRTDDWYRITLKALPTANQLGVNFTATLTGITDPTLSTVTVETTVASSLWLDDAANVGLFNNRSHAYYSFWRVEEATS
jgi:hypothetical protein